MNKETTKEDYIIWEADRLLYEAVDRQRASDEYIMGRPLVLDFEAQAEIRWRYMNERITRRQLAQEYHVSQGTINNILCGLRKTKNVRVPRSAYALARYNARGIPTTGF